MQFVFIIAIMFLGITTAQGQTVLQPNGQTNSSESAVGSAPLSDQRLPCHLCHRLRQHRSSAHRRDRNNYRSGERGNKLRLGDISITFTITGGNTGHIHAGGEHDCRRLPALPHSSARLRFPQRMGAR